jgi:hypothetical protein
MRFVRAAARAPDVRLLGVGHTPPSAPTPGSTTTSCGSPSRSRRATSSTRRRCCDAVTASPTASSASSSRSWCSSPRRGRTSRSRDASGGGRALPRQGQDEGRAPCGGSTRGAQPAHPQSPTREASPTRWASRWCSSPRRAWAANRRTGWAPMTSCCARRRAWARATPTRCSPRSFCEGGSSASRPSAREGRPGESPSPTTSRAAWKPSRTRGSSGPACSRGTSPGRSTTARGPCREAIKALGLDDGMTHMEWFQRAR